MFYHIQILAKKGPLGTIWIAAHHDKRLKRSQIFETSIHNTIDSIITPEVPLALRLSGQLMLGIVRIYARKVGYLFQDCSDSFGRMKGGAKQQEAVNLPRDALHSSVQAITLPEIEEDPDFTQDDSLAFGSGGLSLPGTPISLAGSLAGTPEVLRRASVGSEGGGLRKSLSFDSAAGSPYNAADVDMMYTDEEFGDQGLALDVDVEPEKLRSEEPLAVATPVREEGRTTLTPVPEGGQPEGLSPDLEEVPDFDMGTPHDENLQFDDAAAILDTPDGGAFTPEEAGADGAAPKKKKQKVIRLILDVDGAGSKQISLDNTYVRSRLKSASDTLRDLEKDIGKAVLRAVGAQKAKRQRVSGGRRGAKKSDGAPSDVEAACEDLLGIFSMEEAQEDLAEEKRRRSSRGSDIPAAESPEAVPDGDFLEEGEDYGAMGYASFDDFPVHPPADDDEIPEIPDEDAGAEAAVAEDEEGGQASEDDDEALERDDDGWSSRTKEILARVKTKLAPAGGSARRRSRQRREEVSSCTFEDILPEQKKAGERPLRRDAARCFFECLVLNSKGYVNLEQDQSFGTLTLTPRDLLAAAS